MWPVEPIGVIHSTHIDLDDTPVQAALNMDEIATAVVDERYAEALDGLADFSHLWLLTWLGGPHVGERTAVSPRQVPFLLGPSGPALGIFATRGPRRPNPLGLSLVELVGVEAATIHFRGVDMVDGTPCSTSSRSSTRSTARTPRSHAAGSTPLTCPRTASVTALADDRRLVPFKGGRAIDRAMEDTMSASGRGADLLRVTTAAATNPLMGSEPCSWHQPFRTVVEGVPLAPTSPGLRLGSGFVLRSVLNAVPISLLLLAAVVVTFGVVVLAVRVIRHVVPETREGFHAEISAPMLGVVAALFGLLFAFVVIIAYENFLEANDDVSREADSLAAIVRDSAVLGARR